MNPKNNSTDEEAKKWVDENFVPNQLPKAEWDNVVLKFWRKKQKKYTLTKQLEELG
jgi:hypothetical protein